MSVVNYVINWSEVDLTEALSLINGARVKLTKDKIEWLRTESILHAPPLKRDFRIIEFFFDKVSIIKSVQLNAFGWKDEDQFSIYINGTEFLSNIYIKESAEKYIYNRSFIVPQNSELIVLFHNHSGNSNQISFSIEYGQI